MNGRSNTKISNSTSDFLLFHILFSLSAGMMDYYSFSPNAPTMLHQPPPTEKGKVTMATIMEALPSRSKTAEVVSACYTLSRFSRDEVSHYLPSGLQYLERLP